MCNELEQVGLKDPVYHTNAFMLQVVIYNSKVGKTIVEKTSDSLYKLSYIIYTTYENNTFTPLSFYSFFRLHFITNSTI